MKCDNKQNNKNLNQANDRARIDDEVAVFVVNVTRRAFVYSNCFAKLSNLVLDF